LPNQKDNKCGSDKKIVEFLY